MAEAHQTIQSLPVIEESGHKISPDTEENVLLPHNNYHLDWIEHKCAKESLSSSASAKTASTAPSALSLLSNAGAEIRSPHLLENMMQCHKNRDPYQDYIVLGCLGKGSIGKVEKVVRHHSPPSPKNTSFNGSILRKLQGLASGGVFHNCCVNTAAEGDNPAATKKESTNCWWNVSFPGFRKANSMAAFQPVGPSRDSNNSHGTCSSTECGSILSSTSDVSAFSAPVHLTNACHKPGMEKPDLMSVSQHSPLMVPALHGAHYHKVHHHARRYALKSIRLDRTKHGGGFGDTTTQAECITELLNEISILRTLDHPHIVRAIETYEYRRQIYMVLDLCEGGDLYTMDPYTETEAKCILRQLFGAVAYMHRHGIVHRDLKFENVMFVDRKSGRNKLEIKLIDFGLSTKYGHFNNNEWGISQEDILDECVGTIYTMAPEVMTGNYTYKCDLWSMGVIAYMLLSSQIPFCGRNQEHVAKRILRGNYTFIGKRWTEVTQQAQDFVSSLLVHDASARPSADDALHHDWLAECKKLTRHNYSHVNFRRRHSSDCYGGTAIVTLPSYGMLHEQHSQEKNQQQKQKLLDSQICTSIENFSTYSWLHRLALMVIACRYTGEETEYLRRVFQSFDGDNSGTVAAKDLRRAFALHDKYSVEEIDRIFRAVDLSGVGKITWTEFLAATIETVGRVSEEEFAQAFERLDFDKNGYISTSDLREIMGRDLPLSIINEVIDESDTTSHDHKITKRDFLALANQTLVVNEFQAMIKRKASTESLRRSLSTGEFDLEKRAYRSSSMDSTYSNPDDTNGEDQFCIEKACSIRKSNNF